MKPRIYIRVSDPSQDPTNQILQLTSWAKSRGWASPEVYTETESAWKVGHQKVLAALVEDARKKKFDTLLVWALDRLSREGSLAILSLIHRLNTFGVKIISYQESWTEVPGELAEVLYAIAGWGVLPGPRTNGDANEGILDTNTSLVNLQGSSIIRGFNSRIWDFVAEI